MLRSLDIPLELGAAEGRRGDGETILEKGDHDHGKFASQRKVFQLIVTQNENA